MVSDGEKSRREFMRDAAGTAFSLSVSDLSGLSPSEDSVSETQDSEGGKELFKDDDLLLFDRGADPSHPYDTALDDYLSITIAEEPQSYERVDVEDIGDALDPSRGEMDIVIDTDRLEDMPPGHPLRRISQEIPSQEERLHTHAVEDYSWGEVEEQIRDILSQAAVDSGESLDTLWNKLEEDAETAKDTDFEYNDCRNNPDAKLEVFVPGRVEMTESAQDIFGNAVYHGEEFDAVYDGEKAHLQFHESQLGTGPEDVLDEERYRKIKEGSIEYEELNRDEKVLFAVYSSVDEGKEYNF